VAQSIYTRGKNDDGKWRYARIETGRGKKTSQFAPPFFVRPFRNGKQVWHALGAQTFDEAVTEAASVSAGLEAQAQGLTVAELAANANRVTLAKAIEKFIKNAEATKKRKTVLGYKLNLAQLVEALPGVKFLDQVNGDALRQFRDFLREQDYDPRTQHNRVITALSLLKKNGIRTDFSMKDDLPSYQDEIATPYSDDQLKKLFTQMDAEESIRYKFFIGTGCRDKEVTYAAWDDIDFDKKTYHVRAKLDAGFSPKNHEDRIIPIPTSLVEELKHRKKRAPDPKWIFVNEEGRPDNHFLRKLKRVAFHAGLNCGKCETTVTKGRYESKHKVKVSCKNDPVCEQFFLHRFRKTCATRWHQADVPLRNIQYYLGHKSLETTQIYLGLTDSKELRGNIDRAYGD
jgi:integrase/recombinase XerD